MYKSIKNWSKDERPREKLVSHGARYLSNSELVAILIGSGTREKSAVEVAREMLSNWDNDLDKLGKADVNQLIKIKGIGPAKAITIAAAMELGRRRSSIASEDSPVISSSQDVYQILGPLLSDLKHEEFWVLYLNRSNKVIHKEQLSSGGLTATVVDQRMIFRTALSHLATSIILLHNHPSGSLKPSDQDRQITHKISTGGKSLDIALLDHIIVGNGQFFSFADEGLL
jgi:DNA repair protein RadC